MPLPLAEVVPQVDFLVQQGLQDRLHRGAQIYISHHGVVLADEGVGESRIGGRMTEDILMLWMSASKPLTAVAIMQLVERGQLDLDAPVSDVLPEFGQQGKEAVTTRHILTHTGGFRGADLGLDTSDHERAYRHVCAAGLEPKWALGEQAGYHVKGSWFVLAELLKKVDGRSLPLFLKEEITVPLNMPDTWIGIPPGQQREYGHRLGVMVDTVDRDMEPVPVYSAEASVAAVYPGGNGRGPAHDLGRFYEALLEGGRGVLQPDTVKTMTSRQREGLFDRSFRHEMDWGLGFIPDNNRYGPETVPYGYGPHCSPETFGHSGAQSSVGFADPVHGLVGVVIFNGMPGEMLHQKRMRDVLAALYVDLELVDH